ncbi:MAG: SDR family oxidoreductase [Chloroflexi bacterium]|nr:SDR family oxidoreductase [Chloroflexota bacterium]
MDSPIAGKVALVTASSRYTGAHIAAALARAGAKTAIHYHGSKDTAEAVAERLRAEGCEVATFGADGGSAADLRRMAGEIRERWGGVDVLVNNLGPYVDTPFLKLPEAQWDWAIDTNLKAVYVLAQELAPGMLERGWGRIISISAASAFIRSHSVYGLAKAAVIHLTEALAVELAPHVTVNAIAPGQIEDSELVDEIDPNYKRILREEAPLKKLVTRDQIAGLVLALCGETFATTTGHTFRMDAGWTIPTWQYQIGAVEYKGEDHGDDVPH